MSDGKGQSTMQVVVTTYFPMFIAALSLCTSIYNGYLNNKFVDLIQNNTARVETLRTCKEVIEAYFQVKFKAGLEYKKLTDQNAVMTSAFPVKCAATTRAAKGAKTSTALR